MGAIVKHRRDIPGDPTEGILLDDGEYDAGRPDVLLCSAIDQVVLGNIDRTAHDVGGHVCDQRARTVKVFLDLGSVDGVVGGDMEIVQVSRNLVSLRNIGIVPVG